MSRVIIYGLVDTSNPDKIKYVGKTKQKIEKRLKDHIRESYKLKTKKDEWIQKTFKTNGNIDYKILEICSDSNWREREKHWIGKLKGLTNTSEGGDGGRGLIYRLSYDDLKKWVHKNLYFIKTSHEWNSYVKEHNLPKFIPKYPRESYKNRGWVSWEDFLINYKKGSKIRSNFRDLFTYDEALKYVRQLNIKTSKGWKKFIKNNIIDERMPSAPDVVYKKTNEWMSWGKFLGTDNKHNKDKFIYPYKEAKILIKDLNLTKYSDWEIYVKKNDTPKFLPRHPQRYYTKHGDWISWEDFLGCQ